MRYELGYFPEDDILHSHRRQNFKSYTAETETFNFPRVKIR
jgi:hypothetical protein